MAETYSDQAGARAEPTGALPEAESFPGPATNLQPPPILRVGQFSSNLSSRRGGRLNPRQYGADN
jgi:hypothetical protein